MGVYTVAAENRTSMLKGQMTLAEVEAACEQARALGCGDDVVPTTTNEPVMSATGGPIVSLTFEIPPTPRKARATVVQGEVE